MRKYQIQLANVNHRTYYTVFGKRFDSHPEATKYAEEAVKRRQALAGNELDELTLRRGVDHPDDMDARAKAAAQNFQPYMAAPQREPGNPFDDVPEASVGDRDIHVANNARRNIYPGFPR